MTSIYPPKVIEDVNRRIDIRRMMQVIDYKFDKYQDSSKTVKCFCPIHCEGLFRNLIIDKEQRTFRCLYTQCPGSSGGTLIELYAHSKKLPFDEAIRTLVREQTLTVSLPIDEKFLAQQLEAAEKQLNAGMLDEAEAIYQQLLEAQPDLLQAHLGLLHIYTANGQSEQRFQELQTVLGLQGADADLSEFAQDIKDWGEFRPDSPQARVAIAELTLKQEDAESALMEFMAAADACEAAGDTQGAINAYSRVEQISTERHLDLIDATPHIVRVYEQANQRQNAIQYLLNTATQAEQHEDHKRAAELFSSALELDPESVELRLRFIDAASKAPGCPELAERIFETADFFATRDEPEASVKALEGYVTAAPEDEKALARLIDAYYTQGQPQEAGNIEARLARLEHQSGQRDKACERLSKILEWQPEHVEMLRALADFHEAAAETEEARETRRRVAKALTGQRNFESAAELLDRLIANEPEAADLLDQQASNLELAAKAGDENARQRAVALLERLADKNAEGTAARIGLQYLDRAAALGPSPPALLLKLASAHLRANNRARARDAIILGCEALAGEDKLDEAIMESERFAMVMPQETDLVRYIAELHLRAGNKTAAVTRLRRLADDLAGGGRHAEAKEVFAQAQTLEPQNAETLLAEAEMHGKAGSRQEQATAFMKAASLQEQAGEIEAAAGTLERLLSNNSEDAAAATRLVQHYEKLKRPDEVRKWRLNLARIHRTAGDFDREARVLRDALSRSPEDEKLLALLSVCEFSRRDIPAGVQLTRRLSGIQQRTNRQDEALNTLRRGLERAPDHIELHRDLFDLLKKQKLNTEAASAGLRFVDVLAADGKTAEAASIFDQIVACDPDNIAIKRAQIDFLKKMGREAEAQEIQILLARRYRDDEQFAEAETLLRELVSNDSNDVLAREELAQLYRLLGQDAQAEEQLTAAADSYNLEGEDSKALATLASILQANPENVEVRRQIVQAYRKRGVNVEAVKELHALADVYRRLNSEAEALAAEREAIELAPRDMGARQRYIDALLKSGRTETATDEMEQIATTQIDRGQLEEAMGTLERVLTLQPHKLTARRLRAELYSKLGDDARALEEYKEIASLAASAPQTVPKGSKADIERLDSSMFELALVKEYDFDRFVVGANNNFAYATALAIAKSPARAYNPFFIYADVGLGKTHLCNAIANHLLANDAKAKIIYTNSEDFTGELIEAIQNNGVQQFRARYRNVELLIVDDVQFLAGKERAQEEFFHIFNALFQAKRQIVVTSDRPPAEIAHLESRLRSRFGSGVIVDIASPDLETRTAILNRENDVQELGLDPLVSRTIAEKVDTNVRDLKGALNQVVAMRDLRGQELSEENIRKMLDTLYAGVS
ncbi:MAG: DnaA ATPase domain-containing protein [Candidatus Sumerlaeaceae bacterium]